MVLQETGVQLSYFTYFELLKRMFKIHKVITDSYFQVDLPKKTRVMFCK